MSFLTTFGGGGVEGMLSRPLCVGVDNINDIIPLIPLLSSRMIGLPTHCFFFTHPASITLAGKSLGVHSFLPIIKGMMSLIVHIPYMCCMLMRVILVAPPLNCLQCPYVQQPTNGVGH